ncbi:MAG: hypothetical protein ACRCVN_02805 [Spirochaetia bacterium]
MSRIFIILFIYSFFSCKVPNQATTLSNLDDNYSQILYENKVAGVSLSNIKFPVWWVEPGYANGGSPTVLVFTNNGQVYSRTQANTPLEPTGRWQLDAGIFRIYGGLDIVFESSLEGRWSGRVYVGPQRLVAGYPDYRLECLTKGYEGMAYYEDDMPKNVPIKLLMLFKESQIMIHTTNSHVDLTYPIEGSWSITDLGDGVVFAGMNARNSIKLSYLGLNRKVTTTIVTEDGRRLIAESLQQSDF